MSLGRECGGVVTRPPEGREGLNGPSIAKGRVGPELRLVPLPCGAATAAGL